MISTVTFPVLSQIYNLQTSLECYKSPVGLPPRRCHKPKVGASCCATLDEPQQLLMIESGIRGGIAAISHRHAKANNEYIGAEFDLTKESKFVSYLDINGLYSWAMSKPLPTSGFEWMTDYEIDD